MQILFLNPLVKSFFPSSKMKDVKGFSIAKVSKNISREWN
ncbi:MAG: hypothetical protein ACJAVA_001241 [Flavobacteriaceae bacterium]|jgi:hypothetical protein